MAVFQFVFLLESANLVDSLLNAKYNKWPSSLWLLDISKSERAFTSSFDSLPIESTCRLKCCPCSTELHPDIQVLLFTPLWFAKCTPSITYLVYLPMFQNSIHFPWFNNTCSLFIAICCLQWLPNFLRYNSVNCGFKQLPTEPKCPYTIPKQSTINIHWIITDNSL